MDERMTIMLQPTGLKLTAEVVSLVSPELVLLCQTYHKPVKAYLHLMV